MNNLRLLTGLFAAALSSVGACAQGHRVVTLSEIFNVAEARSAQLRPAMTEQAEAMREISVAKAGRLPDIDASLSVSYIGDGFTVKRNFSDYQKAPIPHFGNGFAVNISQPLYTGGAISGDIELAELKSTAARYAADFRRDNLRFQLTGYYLDIYKYTNLRRVVGANITAANQVLAEMKARFDQGTALRNDITRYELLVSNLELRMVQISNTLEILNTNLVTISGLPEGTVVVPDSTILSDALPKDGIERWQAEALRNSPGISLAQTSVNICRKAEKIVRSERLPKIGLQAGWSIDGPILVEVPPINRNLSYWFAGIGVSYNLSSLYKSNKSIAKSRLATQKAKDDLDVATENLTLAINNDYIRYLEAYEELKTQQKSVELADRNYSNTSTRYSVDMALITDLLDAANSKLDAEQQLVNARINILYYYYKLLFTSGKI
ncbi:MAG: TolC family protein [Muribaculaceae bacterium]|nr:TolC family protein [Muribaculaceae bacterium]